jgi:oligopeptide transport system substrate-binding protein
MLRPILNAEAIIAGELPPEEPRRPGARRPDAGDPPLRADAVFPRRSEPFGQLPGAPADGREIRRSLGAAGRLVSNGAYRLRDWVMQSHIVLERNPYYWDNDNTTIDEVWYYPIENQSTELQRYRADALDMTYDLPFRQLAWIRSNLPEELQISEYLGIYYYGINVTREPFKDNVKLRRALNLAIDRDILTQQVTTAGEIPAYGYVPARRTTRSTCRSGPHWTRRSASPRRGGCTRAGYSPERPLRLQILYNTHENHRTIAVAISSMWKERSASTPSWSTRSGRSTSRRGAPSRHAGVTAPAGSATTTTPTTSSRSCTPRAG